MIYIVFQICVLHNIKKCSKFILCNCLSKRTGLLEDTRVKKHSRSGRLRDNIHFIRASFVKDFKNPAIIFHNELGIVQPQHGVFANKVQITLELNPLDHSLIKVGVLKDNIFRFILKLLDMLKKKIVVLR